MTLAQTSIALRQPLDGRHRQMFIDGAWVDARSGRIDFCNAGHEPPVAGQPGELPRRIRDSPRMCSTP